MKALQKARRPQCVCALMIVWLMLFRPMTARAQEQTTSIQLDPAQTDIRWSIGATLHTVHGTFKLKSGKVAFDRKTGAAQGEIIIDLASGDSGDATRDRNMREHVLEVASYPEARFYPKTVRGENRLDIVQSLTIDGRLHIHGGDHPMSIAVTLAFAGATATAMAHFSIPYVEWGMHNPSTWILRVAKVVDVDVAAKGTVNTP